DSTVGSTEKASSSDGPSSGRGVGGKGSDRNVGVPPFTSMTSLVRAATVGVAEAASSKKAEKSPA
ncbi:MAG: hypothetical protein CW338_11105, partial [Clostridiales bacterium]|nr:hypothetical protein [Clostridiales bacterium]